MDKNELPGKIVSDGLVDNKKRKFKLSGVPDIVVKFTEQGFGIIDFKTTNIHRPLMIEKFGIEVRYSFHITKEVKVLMFFHVLIGQSCFAH